MSVSTDIQISDHSDGRSVHNHRGWRSKLIPHTFGLPTSLKPLLTFMTDEVSGTNTGIGLRWFGSLERLLIETRPLFREEVGGLTAVSHTELLSSSDLLGLSDVSKNPVLGQPFRGLSSRALILLIAVARFLVASAALFAAVSAFAMTLSAFSVAAFKLIFCSATFVSRALTLFDPKFVARNLIN